MKILYLLPDLHRYPGGIARYCHMVCRALHDGAELRVLSLLDAPDASEAFRERYPRAQLQGFNGSRPAFAGAALKLGAQARRGGWRPDLVLTGHVNFSPVAWTTARLAGARAFAFLYGVDVWEPLSRARRASLNRMDGWFAISRFSARRAQAANGVPLSRISILPNCLDPNFALPRLHDAPQTRSLLTVSRLLMPDQLKGHDQVIRAMKPLREEFPGLIYHIIGDGPGRETLQELAQNVGVAEAVRFHGRLSDEEVAQHYAGASAFVMPSSREGFGFVFIEAMAQGAPAVGGNVDATPEVIVDGVTGLLVNPSSVDEIANACAHILRSPALRAQMSRAAQEHVAQTFSFEGFQAQLWRDLALTNGEPL